MKKRSEQQTARVLKEVAKAEAAWQRPSMGGKGGSRRYAHVRTTKHVPMFQGLKGLKSLFWCHYY